MKNIPVIGIGASAGGLKEFERFFKNMPSGKDVAFVLIQHLAPDHKSILAEIVKRYTEMDVFQVNKVLFFLYVEFSPFVKRLSTVQI